MTGKMELFLKGDEVKNKDNGRVILVSENEIEGDGFFSGTVIISCNTTFPKGYYSNVWIRKNYTKIN